MQFIPNFQFLFFYWFSFLNSSNNNIITTNEISPNSSNIQTSEKITNITFDDIKNSWHKIINKLELKNSKISNMLEETELISFDGRLLLIELINGHNFHIKTLDKDIDQIEMIATQILMEKISIKFQVKENSNICRAHEPTNHKS